MGAMFNLDASGAEAIKTLMEQLPGKSGKIIDQVLHGEGADLIKERINRILPESGRTWKGKKSPAKSAKPWTQENGNLSVTIQTRGGYYHYLYFPDDGSSTRHHAGGQHFMYRGAEDASSKIIEMCTGKLTDAINGG